MKSLLKLVIFLFFLSLNNILLAQEDNEIFQFGEFIENSDAYLFADNVNIRETPSTKAKVVANLSIATPVKVISKTDDTLTVNGYNTCWYKISFDKNGSKKTGYVWGGFISAVTTTTTNDSGNKVYFLYAITEYSEEKRFTSTIKAVIDGKIVSSVSFSPEHTDQLKGIYGYDISGKIMSNKGLDDVKKIVVISFLYPACGYSNGDDIVFWNGKELIYGTESPKVSEAGIFNFSSELIFPTDQGGKPNMIIRKEESITYDEEGNVSSSSMKKIEYIWDGKKLVKQDND